MARLGERARSASGRCRTFLAAAMLATSAAASDVPAAWRTPAEVSGYRATPSYDETLAYLRRIGERLPELRLVEFVGKET